MSWERIKFTNYLAMSCLASCKLMGIAFVAAIFTKHYHTAMGLLIGATGALIVTVALCWKALRMSNQLDIKEGVAK